MPNFKRNVLEGLPFTPIPDYFLAQIMTELSPTELRVMLYIYLHTAGYGKKADSIGYDQFINGITTRDGLLLDKGAGVSRRALVAALVSLENKGLIKRTQTKFNLSVIHLCFPGSVANGVATENVQLYITKSSENGNDALGDTIVESELEVQYLHSAKAQQVQKIPQKVQNLHSTIESSHEKHENHDHDGDGDVSIPLTLPSGLALNADKEQDLSSAILTSTSTSAKTSKPKSKCNGKPEPIVGLMISQVPELTLANAQRLVRMARANGRGDDYLCDLVSHVTNNPRIHTPAAVLTALVKANEERSEKRPTAAATPRRKPLPINFEKYRRTQPETANNLRQVEDVGAYLRGEVFDNSLSSSPSASATSNPNLNDYLPVVQIGGVIDEKLPAPAPSDNSLPADSRLKFALHERQPQLAAYLRETRIVPGSSGSGSGDELLVRFIGRPASDNLDWWLPDVQIYHPTVRAIRVL